MANVTLYNSPLLWTINTTYLRKFPITVKKRPDAGRQRAIVRYKDILFDTPIHILNDSPRVARLTLVPNETDIFVGTDPICFVGWTG